MPTTTYDAKILDDSINRLGTRLTTFEITIPRIVLAELNTHRMLSRNSASSRAIPVEKRIRMVRETPYVPEFAANKAGMQPGDALDDVSQQCAREAWLEARDHACRIAEELAGQGAHKQWANRLLEPFCWHTVIISATTWANFFGQRCHPDAQREIRIVAEMMRSRLEFAEPRFVEDGGWHLPLVRNVDEADLIREGYGERDGLARISAGRCARVSYLTHDGRRDPSEDIGLYSKLVDSHHMSPLEHPARADTTYTGDTGNFGLGWVHLRKTVPGEAVFRGGR